MTKGRKTRTTPFARMTTDELQAATAEFEREMVAEEFRSLSPSARSRWKAARRKSGRPRQNESDAVFEGPAPRDLSAKHDKYLYDKK